ncbi:hypothetical protein GG344DRAFT_67061 [Lentinula edodes]|nr:hypothetical protein GG344DRAFT_67061 [Lentinula edodes]
MVRGPSCPILLLLVLIYTSTVAVSFYIQVPQTSATIIGATTGSVVAVHAGSLTFVKARRFWIDIVSGSILFKGSSNCHLLSLTPRQAQLLSQQAMLHKSGRLKLISKKQGESNDPGSTTYMNPKFVDQYLVPVPLPLIWAKGVISTTGSGSISATISSLPRAPATVASSTLSWLNVISLSMQLDESSILISQITTTEIESDISPSPSSSSSGSDPSRTTSSSDLIVPLMISTMSSVGTDSDTLSPASTPIPSSSPSANSSSGNSSKAKAITLAVIWTVFVLGTFLVIYLHCSVSRTIGADSWLIKTGCSIYLEQSVGSGEATSQRSSNMGLREDNITEEGLKLNNNVRTTMSERERVSGRSYRFTIASGSSSQVIF